MQKNAFKYKLNLKHNKPQNNENTNCNLYQTLLAHSRAQNLDKTFYAIFKQVWALFVEFKMPTVDLDRKFSLPRVGPAWNEIQIMFTLWKRKYPPSDSMNECL